MASSLKQCLQLGNSLRRNIAPAENISTLQSMVVAELQFHHQRVLRVNRRDELKVAIVSNFLMPLYSAHNTKVIISDEILPQVEMGHYQVA